MLLDNVSNPELYSDGQVTPRNAGFKQDLVLSDNHIYAFTDQQVFIFLSSRLLYYQIG